MGTKTKQRHVFRLQQAQVVSAQIAGHFGGHMGQQGVVPR